MDFKTCITYLINLLGLIREAEELGHGGGEDKKARVLRDYALLLDSLGEEQAARLPNYLKDLDTIAKIIDLAVAVGNWLADPDKASSRIVRTFLRMVN